MQPVGKLHDVFERRRLVAVQSPVPQVVRDVSRADHQHAVVGERAQRLAERQ